MLGSINQYVEDIYKLEIKQQDAHMRALQHKSIPHFFYTIHWNIFECMPSVKGSEELADVVYAFSALLRNNTNQEKTIHFKKKNWIFVRSMCTSIKCVILAESPIISRLNHHWKRLKYRNLIIQPLVENYFKHGVDFTRFDNALSVKSI